MIYVGTKFSDLEWTHSRVYNPTLVIDTSGTGTFISGSTNTLWERGGVQIGLGSTTGAGVTVHMRNSLFRNVAAWHFVKGTTNWTIQDNLFDTVSVLTNHGDVVQNCTNAYFNTAWGLTSGVGNTNLASLTYEVGPLGKYYLQTNSILINKGTRNATNALLYHFTTTTNQVKEADSVVDIGLHYIALNASNQPVDTDGDGLPDYFEDANGDGLISVGETSWTNADTDGDGVSDYLEYLLGRNPLLAGSTSDVNNTINLRLYTPLK